MVIVCSQTLDPVEEYLLQRSDVALLLQFVDGECVSIRTTGIRQDTIYLGDTRPERILVEVGVG